MAEDPDSKHTPLPLKVAAGAIGAICVIGGPAYYFGKVEGSGDLRAWERAGGERFANLLENMGKVSADLKDRLRVYDENERLTVRVGELESELKTLRTERDARRVEAAQAVQRANLLQSELNELRGDRRRFSLGRGKSTELVPGSFVGLNDLNRSAQSAVINFRNSTVPIMAGTTVPVTRGGLNCVLAVLEIPSAFERSEEVTFEFACPPEPPAQRSSDQMR
jgi:hypothetical protein